MTSLFSSKGPQERDAYVCVYSLSHVQLFATLWTVAHQASLSMFPGKNTGAGCLSPSPGDLPNPGIKPESPVSLALAGRLFTCGAMREILVGKWGTFCSSKLSCQVWEWDHQSVLTQISSCSTLPRCYISKCTFPARLIFKFSSHLLWPLTQLLLKDAEIGDQLCSGLGLCNPI